MAAKPAKHAAAKSAATPKRAASDLADASDETVADGTNVSTTEADRASGSRPVDVAGEVPAEASKDGTITHLEPGAATSAHAGAVPTPATASKRTKPVKGSTARTDALPFVAHQRIEFAADAPAEGKSPTITVVHPGERFDAPDHVLLDLPDEAYAEAEEEA